MFPNNQGVVGPICEAGKTRIFADDLTVIAKTIASALNDVCLNDKPATCTADGVGSARCPKGQVCCPSNQLCGRRAQTVDCTGLDDTQCDDAKAANNLSFFQGTPQEYKLCSGFRVVVGEDLPDGTFQEYKEGQDFSINYTASHCASSSLEISFTRVPPQNAVVTFPQSLNK